MVIRIVQGFYLPTDCIQVVHESALQKLSLYPLFPSKDDGSLTLGYGSIYVLLEAAMRRPMHFLF